MDLRNAEKNKVTSLCEYRWRRGILCKHCARKAAELVYLNRMRDLDSPPFDRPDGYDEEGE
jgi:hypothetical protein